MATAIYGFIYFGMLNSLVPVLMFLAIMLSLVPHDMMHGPKAALIGKRRGRLARRGALGSKLANAFGGP